MSWVIIKYIEECIDCLLDKAKVIVNKHFLPSIISIYVFVVVLFAVINWGMFIMNTTSYLISDQLNKHLERYEFLSPEIDLATYHENAKDNMPITISEFSVIVKSDLERLQGINDSLVIKQKEYDYCMARWDSLSKVASGMREDSISVFREKNLAVYQERIDSLKDYLMGKDSTEMILSGKYVELAKLQYEYAVKNVKIESMISQYIGNFIPDSLSHKIRECNERYIYISWDIQNLETERREVSSLIRNSVADFHQNRLESVNFLDFLYYSICISTTVSFGDIAPNDGPTRFIAILELLLCLFLVGAIVSSVIKNKKLGN